ncbi:WcaF family extracellular polysaccharide biosynthesis acetyltransferase [Vibrio furnissii]|uniref:WcaF family extracellular polysaccharide biosynthesis acetyltransferase n=1 Tax=Vibrio furnissii TaxID=29494 RepID=UPI001EEA94F1|nr:WcaF family extracellular polysaccharide biosynthesis acetyltransferase [Vibrio furnissii]MCG6267264.1 WcaF family extracellular polysaccharide biosynthesis acetyltransferase [Vibrio furnissii]
MKNKVDLSSYRQSYEHGSFYRRVAWIFISALFFSNQFPFPSTFKIFLLKLFGSNIGIGCVIKPSVKIKYPWLLTIGDHCWLGEHVWIDNLGRVTLEDSCCVSQGAYLLTGNHNAFDSDFSLIVDTITLKSGSWVGAKSIVCPGVTLGEGSLLCAGSVATRNLEDWSIFQGNPAKFKGVRNTN